MDPTITGFNLQVDLYMSGDTKLVEFCELNNLLREITDAKTFGWLGESGKNIEKPSFVV